MPPDPSSSPPPSAAGPADGSADALAGRIAAPAPVQATGRTRPPPIDMGHYGMRIARDGTWFHKGGAINRLALVRLFSTVLRREPDGRFVLSTPYERGLIDVEDAPFIAVEMAVKGAGEGQVLRFRTNVDDWVTADAEHPVRVKTDPASEEPSPYVTVRAGLEARIARAVYYDMVELAVETVRDGEPVLGLWSAGTMFVLGAVPEDA